MATLHEVLLAEFWRRGLTEVTSADLVSQIPQVRRPSMRLVLAALEQLQNLGKVYVLPKEPLQGLGRPRARRWRLVTEPMTAEQAREAILEHWRAWAKDARAVNGAEIVSLQGMLSIRHPHLLAWPLKDGWSRDECISTWVAQWARSDESAKASA